MLEFLLFDDLFVGTVGQVKGVLEVLDQQPKS